MFYFDTDFGDVAGIDFFDGFLFFLGVGGGWDMFEVGVGGKVVEDFGVVVGEVFGGIALFGFVFVCDI